MPVMAKDARTRTDIPVAEGEEPWIAGRTRRDPRRADLRDRPHGARHQDGRGHHGEPSSTRAPRAPGATPPTSAPRTSSAIQEMAAAERARHAGAGPVGPAPLRDGPLRRVRVLRPADRQRPSAGLPAGDHAPALQAGGTAIAASQLPTRPAGVRALAVVLAVTGYVPDQRHQGVRPGQPRPAAPAGAARRTRDPAARAQPWRRVQHGREPQ